MKPMIEKYWSQYIFGAIDGSVTTFVVVAAAAGAGLASPIVVILGLANVVADGFSMAASAYLAGRTRRASGELADTQRSAAGDGLATFVSFALVGLVPILIYIADVALGLGMNQGNLFSVSCFLTGATFMALGIVKGQRNGSNPLTSALEMLVIGGVSGVIAYTIGVILIGTLGS